MTMTICIDCPTLIAKGLGSRRCGPCRTKWNKAKNSKPSAVARRAGAPQGGRRLVGYCVCCGMYGPMTRDHIIPLVRGGTSADSNIQLMCRPCNSSKGVTDKCHLVHDAHSA